MDKKNWSWNTQRLPEPARVVRWGHFGTPVLLFSTAGGDYEEVERFHLVRVLGDPDRCGAHQGLLGRQHRGENMAAGHPFGRILLARAEPVRCLHLQRGGRAHP